MGNTALCESLNHICNNERSSNSLSQSLPQVKVKIAITFGFFFQISNKGVNYWLNHKFAVVFCSDKKEGIIRVVLKETLSGRKVGQREYASVDGLEKFLFLVFNMVVLNGSFNLAEVKKVVVLAVYSAKTTTFFTSAKLKLPFKTTILSTKNKNFSSPSTDAYLRCPTFLPLSVSFNTTRIIPSFLSLQNTTANL